MADIKSARELAMEKVAQIGEPTEEERLGWKYTPQGEELAARYLREDTNLTAELSRFEESVKKYVIKGASEILTRNLVLPRSPNDKKTNKKAMDGIKVLKNDKAKAENVYSRMRHLFNYYAEQGEQQRKQAHESLKAEFEVKLRQAVQQQLGSNAVGRIDVESQPQFQQEWRKVQLQLDSQYIRLLDEYKRELANIA